MLAGVRINPIVKNRIESGTTMFINIPAGSSRHLDQVVSSPVFHTVTGRGSIVVGGINGKIDITRRRTVNGIPFDPDIKTKIFAITADIVAVKIPADTGNGFFILRKR